MKVGKRAFRYVHPHGGMRKFAEERALSCGWGSKCLDYEDYDERKKARGKQSDTISENYKAEFVSVNVEAGRGRPKANNISAAKKTVKMIAEKVLLSIEARAMQNRAEASRKEKYLFEREIYWLRLVDACGRENPHMNYDEIRSIAREQVNDIDVKFSEGSTRGPVPPPPNNQRKELKNHLIEFRANEVKRGVTPVQMGQSFIDEVVGAVRDLVRESESACYVPGPGESLGCPHYTRKNKVLMTCCNTYTVCRICHLHDENVKHEVVVAPVEVMKCMICKREQPKTQRCRFCHVLFGTYFCQVCGITDETPGYRLNHCTECNECVPADSSHCKVCGQCVAVEAYLYHVADHYEKNDIPAVKWAEEILASGRVNHTVFEQVLGTEEQESSSVQDEDATTQPSGRQDVQIAQNGQLTEDNNRFLENGPKRGFE